MFAAALLGGLGSVLRRFLAALEGLLSDLLAALHGLLAGLARPVLDLVGDRTEPLVLDSARRDRHAEQKPGRGGSDGQSQRVLLGDSGSLTCPVLDIAHVRAGVAYPRRCAAHLAAEAIRLLGHRIAYPRRDVRLVRERINSVTHLLARVLYLASDLARVLAHCTSSFTLSIVCSGAGGIASSTWRFPASATPVAIPA